MTADDLRSAIEEENKRAAAEPQIVHFDDLVDRVKNPSPAEKLLGGWLHELRAVEYMADREKLSSTSRRVLYSAFRRWASDLVGWDAPPERRVEGGYDVLIAEVSRRLER